MSQATWKTVGDSLKERLTGYERSVEVRSAGKVLFVGDGVLHIRKLAAQSFGRPGKLLGGFAMPN